MKNLFAVLLMGAVTGVLFTGCSATKELKSSLSELAVGDEVAALNNNLVVKNKTTKNEIFTMIGAPSLVFANDIQGESWVYTRVAVRQSNVGMIANGNFATAFPYSSNNAAKGGGVVGVNAGLAISTNRQTYKTAGLLIRFNKNGCVNSYEFTSTSF